MVRSLAVSKKQEKKTNTCGLFGFDIRLPTEEWVGRVALQCSLDRNLPPFTLVLLRSSKGARGAPWSSEIKVPAVWPPSLLWASGQRPDSGESLTAAQHQSCLGAGGLSVLWLAEEALEIWSSDSFLVRSIHVWPFGVAARYPYYDMVRP